VFGGVRPVAWRAMKDSWRRLATSFVLGPAGRLVGFIADVSAASAHYWLARLRGRDPWVKR
jgi:hypothetical protein